MDPDRIRLLKFATSFATGGTERQFVELAERLDLEAFELHLACLKRWGDYLGRVEQLGVPLVEYPVTSLYRPHAWRRRLDFGRYLRRHAIHIVHTYGFYSNVFAIAAARAAGVPLVIASIRDMGAGLPPLWRHAQRLVCTLADCILANAWAVRDWLVSEGYEAGRIHVIHNGIDASRFSTAATGRKLRSELGLPPDAPLVGVLSRLAPLKGLECFLEAAATVARDVPQARFVLAGEHLLARGGQVVRDAGYRERLARAAERLGLDGRVIFIGPRTDIPEILPEITVSVMPSFTEGLSNTLLESMAAGRPIVATRVGGTPEAVEDGATGLLVPPRDAVALARAIGRLLREPGLGARLGRAARRIAVERFSMERMVRDTERLYVEHLAEKSVPGPRRPRTALAAAGGLSPRSWEEERRTL